MVQAFIDMNSHFSRNLDSQIISNICKKQVFLYHKIMKQQTIVHISEEISSLEGIYDLFRHSGGINFPSNLDALEDILFDIQGLHIIIDDIDYFRTIFDSKMTKKYF